MDNSSENWVEDYYKDMTINRITEALESDDALLRAVQMIVAYRSNAKDGNRTFSVALKIGPDEIEDETSKKHAKVNDRALAFITVWLLRIRDHDATPEKTREALMELVPFQDPKGPFVDAETIIEHLKEFAPAVFRGKLSEFESQCLYCVKEKRSGKSVYSGDDCRDKMFKLIKRMTTRPAHEIEETMIKHAIDCGLRYQITPESPVPEQAP